MSRLDFIARYPLNIKINLEPEDARGLNDLSQLIQNCSLDLFHPKEKIILNPTFGRGSELVHGADADLIVDNSLIDIKTTIDVTLTREFFNQLLGYYILYLYDGIENHNDTKIDNIGIYFSRYDFLLTFPIKTIGKEEDFNKALNKLISIIQH